MVGEPEELEILDWEFDEENTEHLARHEVTPEDVLSVWDAEPGFFANMPARAASHVMIGRDSKGRWLYVAIIETRVKGRWRAITGWESRLARRVGAIKEPADEEL